MFYIFYENSDLIIFLLRYFIIKSYGMAFNLTSHFLLPTTTVGDNDKFVVESFDNVEFQLAIPFDEFS